MGLLLYTRFFSEVSTALEGLGHLNSLGKKLLLAVGGIVIALVVGECGSRIILPLLPDPPGTGWLGDPVCGYRLRPVDPGDVPEDDDAHINTMGFRDRNHSPTPAEGVFRILALGDSFVYGVVPVSDNFLRIVETGLNQTGTPAEVILVGVPGWHGGNQTAWLEDRGLALEPELVVVNFFVGNDVTGLAVGGRVIRGNLYPTTSPRPVTNFLRRSTMFLLFETQILRPLRFLGHQAPEKEIPPDDEPVNEYYLSMVSRYLPVYLRKPGRDTLALWDQAENHLKRIDNLCQKAGIPWLLVLIPGEVQVDREIRSQVLKELDLVPAQYDFEAPQRRLKEFAETRRIPVFDLLPALRKAHQAEGRQYVPNDSHWNTQGNATAGRAMAGTLGPWLRP